MISYKTCKNWGIVSAIIHIEENDSNHQTETVNFVIKFKNITKKSLDAGQKIVAGGGGQRNFSLRLN